MAAKYDIIAANCPPIQVRASQLNPASDNPTVGPIPASGNTTTLAAKLVQMSLRTDLLGRYGGGVYAVVDPPTFSVSALTLTYTAFSVLSDGIVYKAAGTKALTTGAYNWVTVSQAGTVATTTGTNPTVPPSLPASSVFVGLFDCLGGTIAADWDLSGVPYLRGGVPWRRTKDAVAPTDTPSSLLSFFNQTAGGLYLWDGVKYWALDPAELLADTLVDFASLRAELDDLRERFQIHVGQTWMNGVIDLPSRLESDCEIGIGLN